jgi:hypothetical protein
MRGVRVDDTYVPHGFTQVLTQRNDQGVVTGCQPQYPDGIVAVPLEESAGIVSTRQEMDFEIAAMSSMGLSRRFLRIV